ncbi:hypothetical protein QW131_17375 [Roseibium salinum]|nr:hypothetical protein [Roseibium salinum]
MIRFEARTAPLSLFQALRPVTHQRGCDFHESRSLGDRHAFVQENVGQFVFQIGAVHMGNEIDAKRRFLRDGRLDSGNRRPDLGSRQTGRSEKNPRRPERAMRMTRSAEAMP